PEVEQDDRRLETGHGFQRGGAVVDDPDLTAHEVQEYAETFRRIAVVVHNQDAAPGPRPGLRTNFRRTFGPHARTGLPGDRQAQGKFAALARAGAVRGNAAAVQLDQTAHHRQP